MQTANTPAAYQVITDRLVAMLEAGTAPWKKSWAGASGFPKNLISKKAYSGINTWMLHTSDYASSYFLTFNQAKELGGTVKKGEKGLPVVFTKQLPVKSVEVKTEKGTETMIDGKTGGRMLRYYTVFNVEQCEGIEAPDTGERHQHDPIETAEKIIAGMPNRPQIEHRGGRACYSPEADIVTMPTADRFTTRPGYYSTLFHELAHSTGHGSRLDRQIANNFGSNPYAKEELIAEMASAYLCAHAGIEQSIIENQAAYLAGWIEALKGDARLAVQAASAAQKAANYILATA
jgi:antirestriction protein ArdC